MGNLTDSGLHFAVLPSQLGDPRTNNEQLTIQPYLQSGNADQSHYILRHGIRHQFRLLQPIAKNGRGAD